MSNCTIIAVDLAKNVYQVTEADERGTPLRRHRLGRHRFIEFMAAHEPVTVLMEACGTAHHFGRLLCELGHRPELLPPSHVKRFVLRDKTDHIDTLALLSAKGHPRVRPVPVKTKHQQTLTALHRLRSGWKKTRQGRICTVRGILREFGVFIPKGARKVAPRVIAALDEADCRVPPALHPVLIECLEEIHECEQNIAAVERRLESLSTEHDTVRRLRSLPGYGLLISTALPAFVGDFSRFPSGRHFACSLGLTPKEHSSGERRWLGSISKRGNRYLRFLLIQGARSALRVAISTDRPDRLQTWARELAQRTSFNHASVALANKLARIAWSVVTRQTSYESRPAA